MFRKASVKDVRSGKVSRESGYIAVCMYRYPRGLPKTAINEYCHALAPTQELLDEFHAEREKQGGNHNASFLAVQYQKKFTLNAEAVEQLRALSEIAKTKELYVVCQCDLKERCHRELLLIAAKRWFAAPAELRTFSYPDFEERLGDAPGELR